VNLSNLDKKYLSHPNYPYQEHINNIANSFADKKHKIAALYHDLGKLCDEFQTYINPSHPNTKKTTHAIIGALIFLSKSNYLLDKHSFPVFLSVLRHHGNLENVNALAEEFNDKDYLINENNNLSEKINQVISIIDSDEGIDIEECCEYFDSNENFVDEKDLSGIKSYYQIKEAYSKLIFADKYEAIFKQQYQEIDLINTPYYINKLESHLSQKSNDLSSVRNSARKDILNNFSINKDKSIFIIEAPTGIGKTFAALHLALEIAKQKDKKRIITALPMTSIIDQTFIEYSKIFGSDILLKYHHLAKTKSKNDEERDEEISEQEYNKQKDSFLTKSWSDDNVIITTFNQILNLFYSNRNRDLVKFWTLRDSVVIMDEIQAIPRVLLKDFSNTISFLSNELNIDFILMSATIPEIKQFVDPSLVAELLDNKYFFQDFNNRYVLRYNDTIDSEEKLIKAIENQFNNNKAVLAVVNSKKVASHLFEYIRNDYCENEVFLLSSHFIPKNREEIITKISNRLKNKEKIILISTQVVEAGVDLDFDCGFREFSPFYSIIQTAGRVNRENRIINKESTWLTIFDEIGFSPYHQNDLLKDEVRELLSGSICENELLPLLKKYFKKAIDRTPVEMLLNENMKNLDFKKVMELFEANFMQRMPYLNQVFIEIENGIYQRYYDKLDERYKNLENKSIALEKKMEIRCDIAEVYKQVVQYVINVPKDEVQDFESFYKEDEMKVCRYHELKSCYNTQTGWHRNTNTNHEAYIF
jgi:CRISPR-associated endonuclease/helicase Cas3